MDIKFGDIKYFTLLGLRDKLKSRDFDKFDLQNVDKLRYEIDLKIEAIELASKLERLKRAAGQTGT